MEPYTSPEWPGSSPPVRPSKIRHGSLVAIAFLIALITLLCAGAYIGGELRVLPGTTGAGQSGGGLGVLGFGQRRVPLPGVEEADLPLGFPPAAASSSTSYKFLSVKPDGTPLSYSPCRPIHYVVNNGQAPGSFQELVDYAIRRTSSASGLTFIYDGVTDELPSDNRASYQPEKYGDRWAPVLIAWTTPAVVPRLSGQTIGLGGSSSIILGNGYRAYVTGTLSLDRPQFSQVLAERGGRSVATAVVMHELGHLLGLDHVDDPTELMYDQASAVRDFAPGDLAGLAKLGSGPCSKQF